ncbi:MAG: CRISPR-associated endonuclease Cas1 [Acetobacteraceae bacterium]|nr:CRISPR-associated endonuclease Cas1 [Acetobacteraceae bacterium]
MSRVATPVHLVVSEPGSFLGKKSERLVVRRDSQTVAEVPFHDLEQVTVDSGGVSISTDAIRECVERGIHINLLTSAGQPYAHIASPVLTGTVVTRREQLLAYLDERGLELSKLLVGGKIANQASLLKHYTRRRKHADAEAYLRLTEALGKLDELRARAAEVKGACIDEAREDLMALEAQAARVYWEQVRAILPAGLGFEARHHRGASDPVNSLLNYGYGILYSRTWGALLLAGLDPFAGYLHADRPGKPSLVLDFVEEFRQQVVDRAVMALLVRGFEPVMEDGRLSVETRRELARRVLERLEAEDRYEGKKHRLRTIMQMQARHLATFLRREGPYRPYVGSW